MPIGLELGFFTLGQEAHQGFDEVVELARADRAAPRRQVEGLRRICLPFRLKMA